LELLKLIITLLVLFAVIGGVGLYRGWFTVNETKIRQDEAAAEKEVRTLAEEAKAKAADLSGKSKD